MDRVSPSQELTTSNCPSPSRSAKNASSGSPTSPTVTAGQRSLRPSTPGLRYTRTSPPCSQGEAMSSNPSPSKSPKRTPSAPNEESSIVWRGQAPSGHATVSESLGPQWIEGTTRMHQPAMCERRRVGIFGCSLLRWGPILPTRDDSTTPAHGFKTIRPVGSVRVTGVDGSIPTLGALGAGHVQRRHGEVPASHQRRGLFGTNQPWFAKWHPAAAASPTTPVQAIHAFVMAALGKVSTRSGQGPR